MISTRSRWPSILTFIVKKSFNQQYQTLPGLRFLRTIRQTAPVRHHASLATLFIGFIVLYFMSQGLNLTCTCIKQGLVHNYVERLFLVINVRKVVFGSK